MSVLNTFEQLVKVLIDKKLHISAAESCTGGLFASYIVSVPDASQILSSSFITYSNDAKINILSVPASAIDEFGVVSEKVAVDMANGAIKLSGAEVGLGITGFAGPAYDENDDTVGTVCFGFVVNGKTASATKKFGNIGRNAVREIAAQYAAQTLISLIDKFGDVK